MGNLTKKQHYVWRKYLKAWLPSGEDARIYTAFKAQNKVNLMALMGLVSKVISIRCTNLPSKI